MAAVTIYTSTPCPYCSRAKALLKARGADFEEIHLPWDDDAGRSALIARTGHRTVPQIFIGENFVGGFDEIAALDRTGTLKELLAA
jgi:glutaredoxin 3